MQQQAGAQDVKIYRDSIFNKYSAKIRGLLWQNRYYIIIGQSFLPNNIKVVRSLDEQISIIEVNDSATFQLLNKRVRITPANDRWKYSPQAEKLVKGDNTQHEFILSSWNIDDLLKVLQKMNQVKIVSVDKLSKAVLIKTNTRIIKEELLPLNDITFIDIRIEPHTEIGIIGYNRSFHGLNAVDYSISAANGKDIVVGVKEQKMDEGDLDLYKRVLPSSISPANTTNHATVISSIIGGSGNRFYDGRGIAYACKFFPSTFDNLFVDDPTILNNNKVTVQNHSYGTIVQQFYGAEAVSYDVHTWQNKNFIHVFSAGNRGTSSATEGKYANIPGFANLTGNFKMAKNIITVGAIDNKGNIAAESSAGPLYDGRIAPQLTALGPNGTSDAAAIVSGTVSVMQQLYADSNGQSLPSASLVKAILYNTADDIYNPGIDYKTGYGLLNSYAAIKSIQKKEYDGGVLSQGQSWIKNIIVPPGAAQLKVTLSWTDSSATANNNKALINDLDLEVEDAGNIYKPWVLSSVANTDSLSKSPVRKRDSLNTAEQVSLQLPAAGVYQIKVTATIVPPAFLSFDIAYHIDTLNTFSFTSPQHASDVNRAEEETLFIRWRTFVADTNQTGNLYISYDKRTSWQLLKQSYKIYTNQYQWAIKDTNSTAVLKMETSFGDFFSKDFIISKVIRPTVDFLCADSFQLSWNKHVYATGYKIFTLTDSPYLKHILTLSDTFVVMKKTAYPGSVYAVEPVLSNGFPAARSIAFDITLQGVKCFYKTIYYNLLDQNVLDLILELSGTSYIDSVFFEQVAASGQLLRSPGGIKVNVSSNTYDQLVNDMPIGTSYWRAKIKLKSGFIVYSETVAVLTTGKKYILFYPNPVDRNNTLHYFLQQGLQSDCKLLLYDMSGRLMKTYSEMPNNIDLRGMAPGMIIYKLYNGDSQLLEIGKIIIK